MTKEVEWRNAVGRVVVKRCTHPLWPGLDAEYCPICQTWWADQQMRARFLPKKKPKTAKGDRA